MRLQSGGLAVFSPVSLTPEVQITIEQLGEVKYIIAPDFEHHIFLGPWKQKYSKAQVIGPEGLREKRARQGNEDVPIDYEFTKENKHSLRLPQEFTDEFEIEYWDSGNPA